ncbi:MAG: chromosome segregation protein SMC [Verrucomicrobiota bacterium]
MRLKSLDIHGFKSFADKTHFTFSEGVTGIVGPNGCGKSNVVDAIRWVLGETSAKALRGGEMADVIFSGTDKRQALGLAEVTLTLTDCEEALGVDYQEIALGRRVFRDGKSDYLINGKPCRLRDIHELFMDTGIGRSAYSIMAQGQIDQILSSKPEERRVVFEEAAGITKFKKQKKEALRKLEYTEANLLRVADIISEVERQMRSLQRQAAKAKRFQALHANVRVLETHHAHRQYRELKAQEGELATSIASRRQQQEGLEADSETVESEVESAREQLHQQESALAANQEARMTRRNEIEQARQRRGFCEERIEGLESQIEQNRSEISATEEKRAQQQLDLQTTEEALRDLEARIESAAVALQEQELATSEACSARQAAESGLKELRQQANEAEGRIYSLTAQIDQKNQQSESDKQRMGQIREEAEAMREALTEKTREEKQLEEELFQAKESLSVTTSQLEQAESNRRSHQSQLQAARGQENELRKNLTQVASRLEILKKAMAAGEGLERGTQSVLKGLDDPSLYQTRVLGLLGESLETEEKYIPAFEAALGDLLQTVLVRETDDATAMVDLLTRQQGGVASLLPADLLEGPNDSQMEARPEGALAWALDVVSLRGEAAPVLRAALQNFLLTETLAKAITLHQAWPACTIATLSGELVLPSGVIRGGRGKEEAGSLLQRQQEIRSLESEVATLREDHEKAEGEIAQLESALALSQQAVEDLREQLQQAKLSQSSLEARASLLCREREQLESRLENQDWEIQELETRCQETSELLGDLQSELADKQQIVESARQQLREREQAATLAADREKELGEKLQEKRTHLAVEGRTLESLQERYKPMSERLAELQQLRERRDSEIAHFQEKIDYSQAEIGTLVVAVEKAQGLLTELDANALSLKAEAEKTAEEIKAREGDLRSYRAQIAKLTDQRNREEVQTTQLGLKLENLSHTIQERYQVELETFELDYYLLAQAIQESQKRGGKAATTESEGEPPEIENQQSKIENPPTEVAEPDWELVATLTAELRSKLESMGPVNLDAITEFEELEDRYEFLKTQRDDLDNSKNELLEVIERINQETQVRFADTFAQIRENFREMFKELFGKGAKADLMLIDESDVLESGIEVIAKPPGKKLQSISLLSGGERSMTAVALLFSIYQVKPSPFCVLDELDAPLDESNIQRFVRMLDRFIDQSQFVIITHSKRTMHRCDVMYGVTMEEFGVSKPVGMRLTQEKQPPEKKNEAAQAAGPTGRG